MKRVAVLLAPGFEEIEAVTVIDVLRRAGLEVTAAGTVAGPIRASRGVVVVPDATLDAVVGRVFDAVVLPGGGPGAQALREDARVLDLVRVHARGGALVAAICAAPTVLVSAGVLAGKRITGHPSVHAALAEGCAAAGATLDAGARVVADGRLVTSQGPGTTMEFALALVERLVSREQAEELRKAMVVA